MQFYRVTAFEGDSDSTYTGEQAAAHTAAKVFPQHQREPVRIELIDVRTDKAGILDLLNEGERISHEVLRTWRLSPRGAMVECPNGE